MINIHNQFKYPITLKLTNNLTGEIREWCITERTAKKIYKTLVLAYPRIPHNVANFFFI